MLAFFNLLTGSGKTAAFLIPILSQLFGKARELAAPRPKSTFEARRYKAQPLVLILAPTRELCSQIFDECRRVSKSRIKGSGIKIVPLIQWPDGAVVQKKLCGVTLYIITTVPFISSPLSLNIYIYIYIYFLDCFFIVYVS